MNRKRVPSITQVSSMISRVVPAISETMALSSPKRTLSNVDFPELGAPRMATGTPDFIAFPARKEAAREETRERRSFNKSLKRARSANSTSSSEKSSSSSRSPANPIKASRKAPISRENPPLSCEIASLWAPRCSEAMRSATASAWVRSRRPFRKARCVNSPGPASLHPAITRRRKTSAWMNLEPWIFNSTVSSPVYEPGPQRTRASPSSIVSRGSDSDRMRPKTTFRSESQVSVFENTALESSKARGPETRTTAIPPAPGAVEIATIVEPSKALGIVFFTR